MWEDGKKDPGQVIEYSREQIEILARCSVDFVYFSKFIKITTDRPTNKDSRMELRPYQIEMAQTFSKNRFCVVLSSRQSGKTTTLGCYALWYAIFKDKRFIGIVSNKGKSAQEILYAIKEMYLSLPNWLKPGVAGEWNKQSVIFENGSRIQTAATSASAFRGRAINLLICDEFAFVPSNLAEEFWTSNYPTVSASPTSQIIIISTPNGMFNTFHKIYTSARSLQDLKDYEIAKENNDVEYLNKWKEDLENGVKNSFVRLKYGWQVVDWRDENWATQERAAVGKVRFKQEYECIDGNCMIKINGKEISIREFYESLLP